MGGRDGTNEGDSVKSGYFFLFFREGFNKVHKRGFISQISDINPTQLLVFYSIKQLIIALILYH